MAHKDWDYMIPQPMYNIFCFVHSTFLIPRAGAKSVRDQLYPYPGVGHLEKPSDIESARFQTYYQWTPIIFFVQACFFYVSHLVWMQLESGTMKNLRLSLHDPALESKVKQKNIQQLVEYFNANVRR